MLKRVKKWCLSFVVAFWDVELSVKFQRHRFGRHIVKAGIAVIPIYILAYGAISYNNVPPHQFTDTQCYDCHYTIPQAGDTRPYRLMGRLDDLCRKCHGSLHIVSHVIGVRPTIPVPQSMPLDETGNITCATCHDPHSIAVDPATGNKTYFLRGGASGRQECGICHSSGLQVSTHRPAMDRAHGFANFMILDPASRLDELSLACMGCHDGPSDPEKTTLGAGVWLHGTDVGLSHPIGTDYIGAARNNKELKPLEVMDARLVLFDGRLGCCTCHDPYMPGGGAGLRVGIKGSYAPLCMGCHIR